MSSDQHVRLIARIPPTLAAQVETYATTHGVTVSQLVRAGLALVLALPPARVRPAPSPPKHVFPTRPAPLSLGRRIARVLTAHPEGTSVASIVDTLNAGKKRWHRTWVTRVQVGSHLRHQWRMGHIGRLARGVYVP
jgi:hypothetical protein